MDKQVPKCPKCGATTCGRTICGKAATAVTTCTTEWRWCGSLMVLRLVSSTARRLLLLVMRGGRNEQHSFG